MVQFWKEKKADHVVDFGRSNKNDDQSEGSLDEPEEHHSIDHDITLPTGNAALHSVVLEMVFVPTTSLNIYHAVVLLGLFVLMNTFFESFSLKKASMFKIVVCFSK